MDAASENITIERLAFQDMPGAPDVGPFDELFSLNDSDTDIKVAQWETAVFLRELLEQGRKANLLIAANISDGKQASALQQKLITIIDRLLCLKEEDNMVPYQMILEEAFTNSVRRRDEDGKWVGRHKHLGEHTAEDYQEAEVLYGIAVREGKPRFLAYINDTGRGFNPTKVPNCKHIDNIEKGTGRGVFLIGYYTKKIASKAVYLPLYENTDHTSLRTRELLIDIPVPGDTATVMADFREWHAAYVPDEPEKPAPAEENDEDEVEEPTLPYEEDEEEGKEITKELETIEFPPGTDEDPVTLDLPPGAMEDPPTIEHPTIVKDEPPVVDDEAKTVTQDEPPMPLPEEEDDDSQNI